MAVYEDVVDPGGSGAYTTLSSWEANAETAHGAGAGDTIRAVCKRTTSTKDTTTCAIAGGSSKYEVTVHADYRHEGKWADTRTGGNYIYVMEHTTGGTAYKLDASGLDGVIIDGILMDMTTISSSSYVRGIRLFAATAGNGIIRNCIVRCAVVNNSKQPTGINIGKGLGYNNLAFTIGANRGTESAGAGIYCEATGSIAENNTSHGWYIAVSGGTSFASYVNNIGMAGTSACFAQGASGSHATNVSSDSSASSYGAGSVTLKTDYGTYFTDYTNGDFHLTATANTLFSITGTDLSGTFTTDIDGQTRSAWDVGYDEYVAGGSSTPLEGTGAATSTGSGSVLLGLGVSGISAAMSAATGTLTSATLLSLAGIGVAQSGASGLTRLGLGVTGAGIAQSGAQGQSRLGLVLSGSALAQAAATAQLRLSLGLAGTASAVSAAIGELSLDGQIRLVGLSEAVAGATGTVRLTISLGGTANALSAAIGSLRLEGLTATIWSVRAASAGWETTADWYDPAPASAGSTDTETGDLLN